MEVHFMHGAIIGAFFAGLALWQMVGRARWTGRHAVGIGGSVLVGAARDEERPGRHDRGRWPLIAAFVLSALGMRGRWASCAVHPAADLTVIMVTLVLPFLSAFVFVFTGGDPRSLQRAPTTPARR
jgi:RsiW-degrading membrane proteinase PrsW (M82 family)